MDADRRHGSDKSSDCIGRVHQHLGDVIWENKHSILFSTSPCIKPTYTKNKLQNLPYAKLPASDMEARGEVS